MTPRSVHEYGAALWSEYCVATRAEKGRLLDQAERVTGYHRKSLIRVLGRVARPPRRRTGRPPRYGPEVRVALARLWEASGRLGSKRLVPFLPELIDALERHGQLTLSVGLHRQLVGISPATVGRERDRGGVTERCRRLDDSGNALDGLNAIGDDGPDPALVSSMDRDSIAAFYELARDLASIERDRFEQAEGKAWRHLYVLVVLLGFALVSSGRTALTLVGASPSTLEAAYVAAFGSFLISAVSAGLISVWNFRVAWLLGAPVDRTIEGFAIGSAVDRFHLELGREFMRAAAENRMVADRKFRLLVWNFRLLILALILGLSVGALYPLLPRGAL